MRSIRAAAVIAAVLAQGMHAQFAVAPQPEVLLVGRFHTPLSYEEVLAKLDLYYQEQIARRLAAAFPAIGPQAHYEVWHDMWVFFAAVPGGMDVILKRQTDAATTLIAKSWMLQIAGRVQGELPPRFEELPALRSAQAEVYGSRRDVARAFLAQPSFRLLDTWQHAGLLVSPDPLVRIALASSSRGVHRVTVTAENLPAAKQLTAKLVAALNRPCVCAAYSETAEIDEELRKDAIEKAENPNATTVQRLYLSRLDPKQVEEKQRAEPEMQKRLAAASGWVGIKYRVDKAYAKINIRWVELTGYSRPDGKFEGERPIGATVVANVRMAGPSGAQLTARTKLTGVLKPGAYRIAIESDTVAGEKVRIDQRDYWFDGKTFEEL